MSFDPASEIQDLLMFGEFGDVNPSITDSSTYTFRSPARMREVCDHEIEGCFLYSRQWNPINRYLCRALAALEATESAQVTASGMATICSTLLQLCQAGDEIICSWTVYGGTYALLKNFLPRYGITTHFVNFSEPAEIARACSPPHPRALHRVDQQPVAASGRSAAPAPVRRHTRFDAAG